METIDYMKWIDYRIELFIQKKEYYEIVPFLKDELRKKHGQLQSAPSDTCERCGCNEFLCGHNARK